MGPDDAVSTRWFVGRIQDRVLEARRPGHRFRLYARPIALKIGHPPDSLRSMSPASAGVDVEIEGRQLKVSNLDKVLYPEAGFTKGQVIDYYIRIAPALLPHLKSRPLTLKRYPMA